MQDIRTLYAAVEERMKEIDFEALWKGFHRYGFALYTKDVVYLKEREIPWDERFLANTTITFEGRQLAIWNIGEELSVGGESSAEWESSAKREFSTKREFITVENSPENRFDVDILTAGMVHEMFHAFQMEQGETRFPDDIEALDYPMETDNFRIKYVENKVLAQTLDTADKKECRELLREFLTLRQARLQSFGSKICYEDGVETVEGMAEYVGTIALYMLSPQKYRARVAAYQSRLRQLSQDMFDVRNQSYYVGTLLLLAAKEAGVPMVHEVGAERRFIREILAERLSGQVDVMEEILSKRRHEREKVIRDFIEKASTEVTGDFEICGYDPMNMFKVENQIYGSNFFALRLFYEGASDCLQTGEQQDEIIRLSGQAVLSMDETGRVKKYYVK
ncbi:MAG: hypothetical protein J6K53_02655 [Roseburia sp.]|nr:hypothetical protein [Roseburia sp.]